MVFAELVTALHREGKTASQYLQELYQRYVPFFFLALALGVLTSDTATDTSRYVLHDQFRPCMLTIPPDSEQLLCLHQSAHYRRHLRENSGLRRQGAIVSHVPSIST